MNVLNLINWIDTPGNLIRHTQYQNQPKYQAAFSRPRKNKTLKLNLLHSHQMTTLQSKRHIHVSVYAKTQRTLTFGACFVPHRLY